MGTSNNARAALRRDRQANRRFELDAMDGVDGRPSCKLSAEEKRQYVTFGVTPRAVTGASAQQVGGEFKISHRFIQRVWAKIRARKANKAAGRARRAGR